MVVGGEVESSYSDKFVFLYVQTNELKLQYFYQFQAKFNYSIVHLLEKGLD